MITGRQIQILLLNSHCSVPWHCCHTPTVTEPPLRGLSVLLLKVECCPTARELRNTQVKETDEIHMSIHVYCVHTSSTGVSRQVSHKMHQTSNKQCRPTLSLAFTLNPQNLRRYSTMDNWPKLVATCKAVFLSSSESMRWPSIFGARYSATARWPPMAHKRKALLPPCALNNRNRLTTYHMQAQTVLWCCYWSTHNTEQLYFMVNVHQNTSQIVTKLFRCFGLRRKPLAVNN